jgi:hypothetical protein
MERIALILKGAEPINAVVIGEGETGDNWLIANPDAVEVTGLDPMPGLGNGWTYVAGEWLAPELPEDNTPEDVTTDETQ